LKKIPLFFFLIILIAVSINPFTHAQPSLSLTVKTGKPSYYIGEYVFAYGNLTEDGISVQDGLVALQVVGPLRTLTVRTLATNVTPIDNWLLNVTDVIPCDLWGHPKESFSRGALSFFNVTVRNNDIEMRQVLVTVTVYDKSQALLGVASFKGIVQENSTFSVIMSIPISETAETGTATVYANAYSDWPRIGGKAYCPEKPNTFEITDGGIQASVTTLNGQEGNYNMTFKLSSEELLGTYTVYVTSMYQWGTASNSTQFVVTVQGDANGDGTVDGSDFFILLHAWDTSPPSDSRADFNGDGVVDGSDFFILLQNWGYST
jgi:hypothetical protein